MRPDPAPKAPLALSKDVARRVARAVKRIEAAHVRPPDQRAGDVRPWQPGVLRAVVTTAIPTGTAAAPSTAGRCTIYTWDPASGASSAGRTGVRVCNDMALPSSVAVGKVAKVAWIDGDLWLVSAECP